VRALDDNEIVAPQIAAMRQEERAIEQGAGRLVTASAALATSSGTQACISARRS
jgi:hypothetical protein